MTTLVLVAVLALLLGAIMGWLERGRRCRASHAHLVAAYDQGDLETFLEPRSEPAPEPRHAHGVVEAPRKSDEGAEVVVRPGVFPGSALPGPNGSAPGAAYVVKAKLRSRIYHTQASTSYATTIPDVWFASSQEAEAAGFRAPRQPGRGVAPS